MELVGYGGDSDETEEGFAGLQHRVAHGFDVAQEELIALPERRRGGRVARVCGGGGGRIHRFGSGQRRR